MLLLKSEALAERERNTKYAIFILIDVQSLVATALYYSHIMAFGKGATHKKTAGGYAGGFLQA